MTTLRQILTSCLFINLATEVWAHVEIEATDYFFPIEPIINYCKMSDECQHDHVPICGQNTMGQIRMFRDNCDLFEYNCDEKTNYNHVKLNVCQTEAEAQGKQRR